jgi:hypothetical protein
MDVRISASSVWCTLHWALDDGALEFHNLREKDLTSSWTEIACLVPTKQPLETEITANLPARSPAPSAHTQAPPI